MEIAAHFREEVRTNPRTRAQRLSTNSLAVMICSSCLPAGSHRRENRRRTCFQLRRKAPVAVMVMPSYTAKERKRVFVRARCRPRGHPAAARCVAAS